jgi:DNA-binding IclR family transcriptional regulator
LDKAPLEKTSGGVEAVDRALTILSAFREGDRSLSLSELSARTGFYKSTILRLLSSLEAYEFVARLPDKSVVLGNAIGRLNSISSNTPVFEKLVRPALDELVAITGETASLYQIAGDMRLCAFRTETAHRLREHIPEGTLLPLHLGAAGHVLRRFRNVAQISREASDLFPDDLPMISLGERDPHTAAIAAPVYDADLSLVGAISVSGPQFRFGPEQMKEFSFAIVEVAKRLSHQLGAKL